MVAFLLWILLFLVAWPVALLALLLHITLPAGSGYGQRLRIVALVGATAVILINFGDVVWWAIPAGWVVAQAIYNFSAVLLAGAVLAYFVRPAA